MKIQSNEKQRASNIIWSASDDYSIQSEFKIYDENGRADLYWNYVIGAVHKYYDYSKLQKFFSLIKQDSDYDLYVNLTWIGLENCVYEKGKAERPVLESMRKNYAKKVLNNGEKPSDDDVYGIINIAHLKRALGEEPIIKEQCSEILNRLEFDEFMNTDDIINRMNYILNVYFNFNPSNKKQILLKKKFNNNKMIHFGEKSKQLINGVPLFKRINIGSAEYTGNINFDDGEEKRNKFVLHWLMFKEQIDKNEREYIQNYFGTSILPESTTKLLEQNICMENHMNCHLHVTRGEFDNNQEETFQQKITLFQRKKNKEYYNKNIARNNNSISKLTNKIKNTMLINFQSSPNKSKAGKLVSEKLWRNIYLNDSKVFLKNVYDDIGDLSVDIMIDASASQINRQEIIATEGYIIAESITRCNIPVRVYSYCNMRNFGVINLFRDYNEVNKNDNIFNYCSAGFNRDGLAIRTAIHMMKGSTYEKKILIVLSDGKPNDITKISSKSLNLANHEYTDTVGVNDTAMEVRKGKQKGVTILCVFTGKDEDIPAAKKIYGRGMAYIKSPERFADIVGVLLQNELKNLN